MKMKKKEGKLYIYYLTNDEKINKWVKERMNEWMNNQRRHADINVPLDGQKNRQPYGSGMETATLSFHDNKVLNHHTEKS